MDSQTLIIGASGFIGSALVQRFEKEGLPLKAAARRPERVPATKNTTKAIKLDLEDKKSVESALEGVKTIYYLAHSMADESSDFKSAEARQAKNLSSLLTKEHKLIYLGGIAPDTELSQHLESRKAVGEIFQKSKAQTIEFRASIVVGRGSASFEMIRALVNRLPFIVTASWSHSLCQPIALKDAVEYLFLAKDKKFKARHKIYEIAGPDRLSYGELLTQYAKVQGLIRPKIEVKKLPKDIASDIMKLALPEYHAVGSKLLESIEANTIANNEEALKDFPFVPLSYKEAVKLAQDADLKEVSSAEILKKLASHPEIPSYLAGQTLQLPLEFQTNQKLEDFLNKAQSLFPFFGKLDQGFDAKIPLVGEIKFVIDKEQGKALIAYRPKYFFQATGWTLISKLTGLAKESLYKS